MPPPSIITPALLSSLRSTPRLPQHCWYYITGITLSALNRPDEIPHVLSWTLENGISPSDNRAPAESEQLKVARRMREGLVKSAAVLGLPKTINALLALKKSTPAHLLDLPPESESAASRNDTAAKDVKNPTLRPTDLTKPSSSILHRGTSLFDAIYGKISPRVMGQMLNSGTADLGLVAQIAYGYILSGGEAILSGPEVSWVLLAALVPQDVNPQLKGHLKGAVNLGTSAEEVRAVRGLVVRICEESGMKVLGEGDQGRSGWWSPVENIPEGWKPAEGAGKRGSKL